MNTTSISLTQTNNITIDPVLIGRLAGYRASQYEAVAATMVVWFDYFLTLETERRIYWGTKWHWTKIAFCCNRYGAMLLELLNLQGLLMQRISHRFCTYYSIYLTTLAGPLQVLFLELIVIVRLYAIFGGSKPVLKALLALLVTTTAASSAVVVIEYEDSTGMTNLIPGASTCFATGRPLSGLWAYWIPIAVFELTACAMALYKTRKYITDLYAEPRSPVEKGIDQKPRVYGFLETLSMHSLIYFACMAILVITGSLIVRFESETLMVKQIIAGPIQAILAILGSRLLLNTQDIALDTFRPHSGRTDPDATRTGIPLGDAHGNGGLRNGEEFEMSDLSETVYGESHGGGDVGHGRARERGGIQLDTIADTLLSQEVGMTSLSMSELEGNPGVLTMSSSRW